MPTESPAIAPPESPDPELRLLFSTASGIPLPVGSMISVTVTISKSVLDCIGDAVTDVTTMDDTLALSLVVVVAVVFTLSIVVVGTAVLVNNPLSTAVVIVAGTT